VTSQKPPSGFSEQNCGLHKGSNSFSQYCLRSSQLWLSKVNKSTDVSEEYLQGPRTRRASSACYLLHATFLLGLFFDPEVGGDMFFRNVCYIPQDGLILLGLCTFKRLLTRRFGVVITFSTCIREVLGSILGQGIGCLDRNLSRFSTVLPDKRWDSTSI
jgi:hypothetical protein